MKAHTSLPKLYNNLTGRERFALILAAEQRGDKSELETLRDAAPWMSFRAPNYLGALDGFNYVSMIYLISQLETALTISTLAHFEENDDAFTAAQAGASILLQRVEGWKRFCGQIGIEPDLAFVAFQEVKFSLEFAFQVAESIGLSPKEVEAELQKRFPNASGHFTAEAVAEDYFKAFDAWASKWE